MGSCPCDSTRRHCWGSTDPKEKGEDSQELPIDQEVAGDVDEAVHPGPGLRGWRPQVPQRVRDEDAEDGNTPKDVQERESSGGGQGPDIRAFDSRGHMRRDRQVANRIWDHVTLQAAANYVSVANDRRVSCRP